MHPVRTIGRKHIAAAAGFLSLILFSSASAEEKKLQAALDLIPPDAPVAVIVPDMAGLSQKIAHLNEASLGSSIPQMADVLGTLKGVTGVVEGFDDSGSFLLIITSVEGFNNAAGSDEPPMALLVPVTDYDAFLGNFEAAESDQPLQEGISSLVLGGGSPAFTRKIGGHALITPTQELAASFQPGHAADALIKSSGTLGGRCLSSSDAAVLVNVQAVEPIVRPQLQGELNKMAAHLNEMPPEQAAMMGLVKSVISIYGDTANALLRDTATLIVGMDLTEQGVGLTYTVQFKPGSHLARVFTQGGGAANLMARLPRNPYLLASSTSLRGVNLQMLSDDLRARMPQKQGDELTDPMVDMFEHVVLMIQRAKGTATLYAPPNQEMMMGGGGMNSLTVTETEDPQAYKEAIRGYLEGIEKLIGLANNPALANPNPNVPAQAPAPQPQVSIITRYTPDALQVAGVSVDEYAMQIQFPPAMMQELGPAMPLLMMMGGTGYSGYIAAKDNFVLMTTTPDAQLLETALAAVGQKGGLGTGGSIQRVRQTAFGANPAFEGYIGIPGILQSANMFMAMMGMPPIQAPEDLPPLAVGGNIEGHGVSVRLYTPTEVIRFCYDTANQFMMQMNADQAQDPHMAPDGYAPGPQQGPPPAPF